MNNARTCLVGGLVQVILVMYIVIRNQSEQTIFILIVNQLSIATLSDVMAIAI